MSRFDRRYPQRALRALVVHVLCLAVFPATVAAAAPCTVGSVPWLTLTVTTGSAITVADRELRVRVHHNGCVELHRPSFYRLAGDYRLALTADEFAALRIAVVPEQVRRFDAAKVRTALKRRQLAGGKSGMASPEAFAVLDGDHFVLELRDGGKRAAAAWTGLHDVAEFYPEVAELQQLSRMVKAVQQLLAREDAVAVAGGTP
jgi:hypothetical protein